MAIAFARSEYVSRSTGANACCKGAYNARAKIKDEKTCVTYNFSNKKDNAYHEMLLPKKADDKFKDPAILSNEVERTEKKKNSQLYVEWVLALPKEEEVSLELKIEMVHEFIKRKGWVKEGLGVQIDIHAPHEGEVNWHAHLLVTTRRFTKDGKALGDKARDLQPQVRFGKVQKTVEIDNNIFWREVQNDLFKEHGLDIRVDLNGERTQEHIGPKRMRSLLNQAVDRNEIKRIANLESLKDSDNVLDRITTNSSIFVKEDIERLVALVDDKSRASSLVRETLQSDRIEVLYTEDALATKYFTTKEVRAEELKLMRLSEYVYGQQNGTQGLIGNNNWRNNLKTQGKEIKLSEEQEKALSHLLLGEGGIRILRGRAGTGKSHVLGNLASIANKYGQNVIGLAPTHKAKDELVKVGFHNADTVKGMLFKLYNGRFHLPKNSLLVVDEAGMIGNDDYIELVRIAANKQCDLILAGDERQIASIQRGGMFEIFADKFGSTTLFDIQRQITNWGREVATSFSIGDVLSGINVLKEQGRIIENRDKVESMEQLLQDWNVSEHSLENKIILAVKNKDVDALNIGARQYLKANGTLSGDEISVGGNHFMSGDIVMIRETNKELGVINGDSGRVLRVSKEEFVLELIAHNNSQKQKKISFNPRDFSGFKHAYATTIFKAQGASIFEVFVFHDGLAGLRNSYVSLSRHIKELKLYINTQATKSLNHLVKQMGIDPEISSSLGYYTKAELEKKYSKPQENAKGLISSIVNTGREFFGSRLREFKDKHIPDFGYYNYEAIPLNKAHVEKVLDNGYIEEEELEVIAATSLHGNLAIQAKGGGVITSKGSKLTPKQRFYAKVDKANSTSDLVAKRAMWDRETEQLKHEAKFRADEIARNLLGSPNEKLSNNKTLRFGESGKIAVRISGDRAGQWYDFAQDKGGDIFSLVSETIGGNFKSSAEHLRSMLGLKQSSNLHLVEKHRNSNLTEKHIREKEAIAKAEKAKQAMVLKLIEKAKPIKAGTIAYRYLLEHRGISCELSSDLCSTDIWAKEITKEKGAYLPTLIAFARDKYGEITGGQQIFLDKHRCGKANIDLAKKSFGKIAGSFVYLDEVPLAKTNTQDIIKLIGNETKAHITIIAEGLETGLSVKQALNNYSSIKDIDIKVLCSLGISNIKNYMPITGEKIIIAADNDGENSPTSKTIQNAKEALCQRNALVEIVMPQAMGDFNDVIRENDGESKIQAAFARAILKQTAKNLDDFFRSKGDGKNIYDYLDKQELADLNLMREYGVSELCIVEAYRGHKFNGKLVLEEMRKQIDFARFQVEEYKDIVKEAECFGYKAEKKELVSCFVGMEEDKALNYINGVRDQSLRSYLDKQYGVLDKERGEAANIDDAKAVISKEQNFLIKTASQLKSPLSNYGDIVQGDLIIIDKVAKNPSLVDKSLELADKIIDEKLLHETEVSEILLSSRDIEIVNDSLEKLYEKQKLYIQPEQLIEARAKAKAIDEALELINREQSLLSRMHNNIRHHSVDKELLYRCEIAKSYTKEEMHQKLILLVKDLIATKEVSERDILKDLQTTKDISATYKEFDIKLEAIEIKKAISNIFKEKNETKTIDDAISVIRKGEDYYSSLDGSIKYREQLDSAVTASIKAAKQNKQDNVIEALNKLSKFMQVSKGYQDQDHAHAVKALKSASNTKEAYNSLLKTYHDYFMKKIHIGLEHINEGKTLVFDKQKWTCPIKFIDHVMKNSNKQYAPMQELKIMRTNIIEREKHHEMGGPSL